MSQDFKNCLDRKKLYKSDGAKGLSAKEFERGGKDNEEKAAKD